MQFYARVFTKILTSSIARDWQVRHVFEDLLKLADEDGTIDMPVDAIARLTNVPVEIVERAVRVLESPDPSSHTQTDGGRRLARLDDHRDWGWLIVTFEKYGAIKNKEDERRRIKERVRKYRSKFRSSPAQVDLPLPSDSPLNTNTKTNISERDVTFRNAPVTGYDTVTPVTSEDIYQAYPRKEARSKGIEAIEKAMKAHSPEYLLERVRIYAGFVAQGGDEALRSVPYPATFFNQERFTEDEKMWRLKALPVNGASLMDQIKCVKEAIATHPANPEWIHYDRSTVTEEQKQDFKARTERLRNLMLQV